jgi:peptide/nickel transport system permease protein
MARYFVQRFIALIGILFLISVGCFGLVHLIPGNPAIALLGVNANPHALAQIDAQLGLNQGLIGQYTTWFSNVLHGNLGISNSGQTVDTIIGQSYRVDLELIFLSQFLALLVAVPLSVYAARRPNQALDSSTTSVTFALYCLPTFIVVIWFVQFLTVKTHIFPGPGATPFPPAIGFWNELTQNLHVMIGPSIVLALGSLPVYYRLLRGEMVATLQEDFIMVARSKGLKTNRILWRHALRPSSVTTLTSMGNAIALLITGLFVVEYKFGLTGIGSNLIYGIMRNDYLLIQGIALFAAVIVVVVNFGIDLLTFFVDPRIARA